MNAYCTYDDDSTCYDFAESGGSAGCGSPDCGTHDFGDDDWYFEDADAVERHAMRRATVASILVAISDRMEDGEATATSAAVSLLTWSAQRLNASVRRALAQKLDVDTADEAGTALALWRGGAMDRGELRSTAREFLDAARVQLAVEAHEDARVIEGPWRRGTPPLERTRQLHLLYLAVRHAELRLDEVDEQVVELWQEELRTELSACQRETQREALDPGAEEEHFAQSVHLVAAAAEMWRDTAPAARPIRLPLEKLTRLLWRAARRRKIRRPERAALLIAAGNQRLDDLPSKQLEAGLYVDDDSDCAALTATWVGGRRPGLAQEPAPEPVRLDLATEALVIRALSGPSRTGPRRG